jgi:hypothetical protein
MSLTHHHINLSIEKHLIIRRLIVEHFLSFLNDTADIDHIFDQLEDGKLSGTCHPSTNPDEEPTWRVWQPFEQYTAAELIDEMDTMFSAISKALYQIDQLKEGNTNE